jgi:hypothetical protein
VFATDYLVTSTNDSGSGTFREALGLIEAGDTITFDTDLSGTITLASALPTISIDTVITGPTTGNVTIDGDGSYQIFDIDSWTTITNLSLTNNDTSTSGSALLVSGDSIVVLDTISIPHCDSCEAPVLIMENGLIISNNLTFSSSGTSGTDILFQENAAAMFGSESPVLPQVWVETTGTAVVYKEGSGTLELKAASSVGMNLVADEGTVIFSGTSTEPVIALSTGTFQGAPDVYYVANAGIVKTGDNFGTITNTAGYFQDDTGTLILKINASGSTDLIQSPEAGQIDGDLIIQLAPGTYTASSTYTLLACDGGFTAEFDNAYFDIPGQGLQSISNASLNYNTDTIVLEITSTFVVDPPENISVSEELQKGKVSPVAKLFKWVMEHKKRPNENVRHLLYNYLKYLKQRFHP